MTDDERIELYRSLVEQTHEMIGVLEVDGTIVFVNPACAEILGGPPEQYEGTNFVDLLHPDDIERALLAMTLIDEFGSASGTTMFRARHIDGSWVPLEVTQGLAGDGRGRWFATFSRAANDRLAFDNTLARLLRGAPLTETLDPVCDMFAWQGVGSRIAISWVDDHGVAQFVSRDLPAELAGAHALDAPSAPGDGAGSPWAQARRAGVGAVALDLDALDPSRRDAAVARGLGAYWIEPVTVEGADPALITVWTVAGGRPPHNHASGMEVARRYVELILRWTGQQQRLDHAANHDALTGLANRSAFFAALDAGVRGGALLYCDLDRFKPVNDRFGHTVGDRVLCEIADRLRATVGPDDLVARLGGDEFAVVCDDATRALDRAEAIRTALARPIQVGAHTIDVGVSIGVAHTDDHAGTELLDAADAALYAAKAAGRDTVRVAPRATPT